MLAENAEFDAKGRAIVNVRWVVGKGRVLPMTTMQKAIILKRDPNDETTFNKISCEEAVQYLEANGFCNPHLLVKDERKKGLRRKFFKEFFSRLEEIYIINTSVPILEAHGAIKKCLELWPNA